MGLLQPESGLLFWMVISFGVVFVLLAKFGFPVITRMVEERRVYVEKSLEAAKQANEQLAGIVRKAVFGPHANAIAQQFIVWVKHRKIRRVNPTDFLEKISAGVVPCPVDQHVVFLPFSIEPVGFPTDYSIPCRGKLSIVSYGVILRWDGQSPVPVVIISRPTIPMEVHQTLELCHAITQVP